MIEVHNTRHRLFKSSRPGYPGGTGPVVSAESVLKTIKEWKRGKITHILCLLPDEEQLRYYGKRLTRWYRREGLHVIEFPIADFSIPRVEQIIPIVRKARAVISDGRNRLLVHCSAGIGRTGMMLSCLALYMRKYGPFRDMPTFNPQTQSQRDAVGAIALALGLKEEERAWFSQRTDDSDRGDVHGIGIRKDDYWSFGYRPVPPPPKDREGGASSGGRSVDSGSGVRVRVQDGGEHRKGSGPLPQHRPEGTQDVRKGGMDPKAGSSRPPNRLPNKGRKGVSRGEGRWTENGWEECDDEADFI